MQLTVENIKFIDNYLKNIGIIYYDIRMEILDHVATAVEQKMVTENLDFYDTFRGYMLVHKTEILKGNKIWSVFSKDIIIHFFKFLIHPIMILGGVSFYFFYRNFEVANYFSESFTIRNLFFLIVIILACFQLMYFRLILKQRFFVLEKLSGLLAIIYYLQMFFMNSHNAEAPSIITLTLFSYVMMSYLLFFVREIYKFNTNQNKFSL